MRLLKIMDMIVNYFGRTVCLITGIAVPLVILIAAFLRYTGYNFSGYEEIVMLCAFWLYFMGSVLASRDDTQIQADMCNLVCKDECKLRIIHIIKYIVSLFFSLVGTYWAFQYLSWSFARNPKSIVYRFPMTISQMAIMVCFVLMSIYLVVYLTKEIKKKR